MAKVQLKADLQRLCHHGDCLGLLLMHARCGFFSHSDGTCPDQCSFSDDLDRAVSG